MENQLNDRTIELAEVSDAEAETHLNKEQDIGGVADAIIRYKQVEDFTTFTAEYAWKGQDIVVHFFTPKEFNSAPTKQVDPYWLTDFPMSLDRVARAHFRADAPRLQAKYTEELKSWWLLAQGYGNVLDLDAYMIQFFEVLDTDLSASEHLPESCLHG